MGKTVRKSFNGRNSQQMTRVTKGFCLYKNSDPKWLSAPALGLYTCIKMKKLYIKSDFKDSLLKLATNGQNDKAFLLTLIRILPTKGCLPLPQGYIHVEKH